MGKQNPFLYVVNCKAYPGTWGTAGRKLLCDLARVAKERGVNLMACVAATEIHDCSNNLDLTILAQGVSGAAAGAHNGALLPEMVKEAGASGTLLNHSELPLAPFALAEAVKRCQEVGLATIVCARDPEAAKQAVALKPDYLAYEPPAFIGGKISVSQAKPEVIKSIVEQINCSMLVGAGINNRKDVVTAKKLGAQGILVAAHVFTAEDPVQAFKELII